MSFSPLDLLLLQLSSLSLSLSLPFSDQFQLLLIEKEPSLLVSFTPTHSSLSPTALVKLWSSAEQFQPEAQFQSPAMAGLSLQIEQAGWSGSEVAWLGHTSH